MAPASPPTDDSTAVVGTWVANHVDGHALPSLVKSGAEPAGWTWEVHILSDSLVITADGRWVQRVHGVESNSKGEEYPQDYYDRGVWTREGDTLHFVSTYIENVAFDGHLRDDGVLVIDHDVMLDDEIGTLRQELAR